MAPSREWVLDRRPVEILAGLEIFTQDSSAAGGLQ
jgi:hypothetical protein